MKSIARRLSFQKFSICILIVSLISPVFSEQPIILKYGTLAPKGTSWANFLQKFENDVEKRSNKRVKIKIFFGGIAGDERTMVRKLKVGGLDIVSLTGIGLGLIVSDVRVLETPYLFTNYKQVDKALVKLVPVFENKFQKKGFEVLGWSETGFIYLMSKKFGSKISDLRGMKVWLPSGDPLTKEVIKELELVPVPMGIESVLTQLKLNGLDAIYAPPMAAIGLQWYKEVKYIADFPLAYATSATIMNSKAFDKLTKEDQKLVKEVMQEQSAALIKAIRKDNESGFKILKKQGIQTLKIAQSEIDIYEKAGLKVQKKMIGKLYSKKIYKQAVSSR